VTFVDGARLADTVRVRVT